MTAQVSQPLLQVTGLVQRFERTLALDDIDFCVAPLEVVGVVGPNGSGKSTLLNVIAGQLRPTAGRVWFSGTDITDRPPHQRARLGIARCSQVVEPPIGMSVREVVMVGALFGRDRRERRVATAKLRADEMLSHLGLDGADRPAATLNIVDRKRLALARALAMEPKLLLLDEVMAGLTPPEVEVIASLLAEVHAGGIALIIVEHLMHAIARLCERAVVLHQGRVLAEGPPGAVLREAQVVEAYLGHGRSRMIAERRTGSEHH